ncbi:MAG TPA: ABC transporter permease [Burkholderiaceae bacterium]|nr:ABC transporter permease [Burkholderiaceae bacterium]
MASKLSPTPAPSLLVASQPPGPARPVASPNSRLIGSLNRLTQEQIVFGVAILLVVTFSMTLQGFATFGNAIALVNSVAVVGILSLGAAIVIIGRGLDLSQVGSMVVGAAVAALMMRNDFALGWALLGGLATATLIGLINGFVIAFVEVPALFATLATNLLILGLARIVVFSGDFRIYLPKSEAATAFRTLGGVVGGIPIPILVFLGMALLIHVFLSRTRIGRLIYAHGDNPQAARESGVAVRPLTIIEYVLCADIGFVAGLVLTASLGDADAQIITGPMIFDVILVTVLGGVSLVGGRGSVYCVLAGALLIGVILNGMTLMNLNNDIQNIVRGLVLLGAIVLDNRLHPRDEETARQGE